MKKLKEMVKDFVDFYGKNIVNESTLINGVKEFLIWCKEKKISMAVCTNKREHLAIDLLKKEKVDFDFDGEMQPDVALNPIYQEIYPFSKIVGNANILIMPALHSAAISTKLMKVFGGGKLIGPLLIGLGLPIEVAPLRASTSEILNLASIASYSSDVIDYSN